MSFLPIKVNLSLEYPQKRTKKHQQVSLNWCLQSQVCVDAITLKKVQCKNRNKYENTANRCKNTISSKQILYLHNWAKSKKRSLKRHLSVHNIWTIFELRERCLCEWSFLLMRYILHTFSVSPGKETIPFLAGKKFHN